MSLAKVAIGFRSEGIRDIHGAYYEAIELGPEVIEVAASVIYGGRTTYVARYWATQVIHTFIKNEPGRCREILLGALSDRSPLVRLGAATALSAFADDTTILCLESVLEDQDIVWDAWTEPYTVGEAARDSLATIRNQQAQTKDQKIPVNKNPPTLLRESADE